MPPQSTSRHASGARQFISAAATMAEIRNFAHCFAVDPKNKDFAAGADVKRRASEIGLNIPACLESAKITYLGRGKGRGSPPVERLRGHVQACFRVIIDGDDTFGHIHYDIEYCIDCTEVDPGDWTCFESLT